MNDKERNAHKENINKEEDENNTINGAAVEKVKPVKGRGRPIKGGKKKNATVIAATGKGRGRPKNPYKEADDGTEDPKIKKAKVVASKGAGHSPGRPRKVKGSDDESSDEKIDDYEVKRGVGRPPSDGVNLNIVSTGRGRGRPKKVKYNPGRPKSGKTKSPYKPTGKPRGRPKRTEVDEVETEEDIADANDDDGGKEDGVESVSD